VAIVGQRRHHDVGDVVGVDERLLYIADRQRNTACENLFEPGTFTEVLREEGASDDRPVQAARCYDGFGAFGLDFIAAGVDRSADGEVGVWQLLV
jgi:hypothetical protein